jgi:hypothetical protein
MFRHIVVRKEPKNVKAFLENRRWVGKELICTRTLNATIKVSTSGDTGREKEEYSSWRVMPKTSVSKGLVREGAYNLVLIKPLRVLAGILPLYTGSKAYFVNNLLASD